MELFRNFAAIIFIIINLQQCNTHRNEIPTDVFSYISTKTDVVEKMCHKQTGDNETFEKLKEIVDECRGIFSDHKPLTPSSLDNFQSLDLYELHNTHCDNHDANRAKNECNQRLTNHFIHCLNETERKEFKRQEKLDKRFQEEFCKIDKNQLKNFSSEKAEQCVEEHLKEVGLCYIAASASVSFENMDFMMFDPSTEKNCKIFEDFKKCVMTQYNMCEEKMVAHMTHLIMMLSREDNSCDEGYNYNSVGSINVDFTKISALLLLLTIFLTV